MRSSCCAGGGVGHVNSVLGCRVGAGGGRTRSFQSLCEHIVFGNLLLGGLVWQPSLGNVRLGTFADPSWGMMNKNPKGPTRGS